MIVNLTDNYWSHSNDLNQLECQIDWVRTLWQKIHYLASEGMRDPRESRIKEINSIYAEAWYLTARLLQQHLTRRASGCDLSIDSDWLVTWLASNVLLSQPLAEHYALGLQYRDEGKRLAGPADKVRYCQSLSQHILYALHCCRHAARRALLAETADSAAHAAKFARPPFTDVPLGLVPSLSEAQLFVLSEYANHEIGLHRELRIFNRLMRQLYFELPLYATGKFYRDHLYHVVDVCLMGELLLRSLWSRVSATGDDLVTTMAHYPSTPPAQLMRNWYMAALCHDLGYIVEQLDKMLEPAGEIAGQGVDQLLGETNSGLERGKQAIRAVIQTILSSLPEAPPSLVADLDRAEPTDHGIVAWLHLREWLKQVRETPEVYAHALNAILRHNLADQEVDVYQEPLTLLLMLCDHLQEWGRPRVGTVPLAQGVMEALRFSEPPEFAAYLLEWIELARKKKKGVEYQGNKKTGEEVFTIKLHQLDRPLRRGLTDEHWQKFPAWKWKRLGSRVLSLNFAPYEPNREQSR